MGRSPCCHGEAGVKKGPWTPEEDELLVYYIQEKGHGRWRSLPKLAGLNRCGKSCRLRWTNYLCPDIKRGRFTDDEGKLIIQLHSLLGNKWSSIAKKLPGRTDNEIKNYWNTHLRKKLLRMGIDPVTHRPRTDLSLLDGILAADGSWNFELLHRSSPYGRCAMDFADLDEREGDYTPRLVNSSWINKLLISAYHEKYRVRQPLPGISIVQLGGLGKRALVRHVYRDFDSDIMFQNTDSKTLLCSIVNQVSEQPLNASIASYESIRRKMKDTIDFVLGIDRQDAIRKKGIDMDILWCVVDALAEECNRAKFSDGPNKGRRVVPRRSLARKNRDQKRHDIRAASQKNGGLVSRSEPISADNSSLLTPDSTPERAWRVAAAAPQHMTGYLKHFTNYTPASGDQVIDTPTMGPMVFHGRGSVNTTNMTLRDVLYVPGLETSLVSTGQLAELGYTIAIGPYGCRVYKDDEGMDLVGKAHYVDGYLLELDFLRV